MSVQPLTQKYNSHAHKTKPTFALTSTHKFTHSVKSIYVFLLVFVIYTKLYFSFVILLSLFSLLYDFLFLFISSLYLSLYCISPTHASFALVVVVEFRDAHSSLSLYFDTHNTKTFLSTNLFAPKTNKKKRKSNHSNLAKLVVFSFQLTAKKHYYCVPMVSMMRFANARALMIMLMAMMMMC